MITSADMSTLNDVVNLNVLDHKLNIDNKFSGKQAPVRNQMKMTTNEYREFIASLGFSMKYFKTWINTDVLANAA
jgi:hypothetical protein